MIRRPIAGWDLFTGRIHIEVLAGSIEIALERLQRRPVSGCLELVIRQLHQPSRPFRHGSADVHHSIGIILPHHLSDAEAKAVLQGWPTRTKVWTPTLPGWWLRAQPVDGHTVGPRLKSPGSTLFVTQPDGMWLYIRPVDGYVDALAIEVCTSAQNLNDKRSRYMPAMYSIVAECPRTWLLATIAVQRGGQQPRWRASGTFTSAPPTTLRLPVRFLRVLYALPNALYRRWMPEHVPVGYEYFVPHSSLSSYHSPAMQTFLRRLTLSSHGYMRPGRA